MIEGEALSLGWLAAGSDVWTVDATLARIMGFAPQEIPYLRHASSRGVSLDVDESLVLAFREPAFRLDRNFWNRVAKATWYSASLNHLVYFSRVSNLLHRAMYSVRRAPEELAVRGPD